MDFSENYNLKFAEEKQSFHLQPVLAALPVFITTLHFWSDGLGQPRYIKIK